MFLDGLYLNAIPMFVSYVTYLCAIRMANILTVLYA